GVRAVRFGAEPRPDRPQHPRSAAARWRWHPGAGGRVRAARGGLRGPPHPAGPGPRHERAGRRTAAGPRRSGTADRGPRPPDHLRPGQGRAGQRHPGSPPLLGGPADPGGRPAPPAGPRRRPADRGAAEPVDPQNPGRAGNRPVGAGAVGHRRTGSRVVRRGRGRRIRRGRSARLPGPGRNFPGRVPLLRPPGGPSGRRSRLSPRRTANCPPLTDTGSMSDPAESGPLVLRLGRDELLIRRRYEVLSIVNDFLIALWFIVGSILFFSPATATAGTWMFLLGSLELGIRPVIRLSRHVQLRRWQPAGTRGSDQDY